ncbi:MAG: hypothetical protein ACUVV6_02285 [Thermoplasmatota archaeon]
MGESAGGEFITDRLVSFDPLTQSVGLTGVNPSHLSACRAHFGSGTR